MKDPNLEDKMMVLFHTVGVFNRPSATVNGERAASYSKEKS